MDNGNTRLSFEELAELFKVRAGVPVDPQEMVERPEATFADFGLDSLALLGIVGELENRYAIPIGADAEACKTPGELVDLVNSALA